MNAANQSVVTTQTAPTMLNQPALLLLLAGILIGLNFPLSKLAGQAGAPALLWVMLISLGAAITLFPVLVARRSFQLPRGRTLRYALIAGPITFAGPNLLLFLVVPHTGAGYAGMMFSLSPLLTLILSALFRVKNVGSVGSFSIVLGLLGALLVSGSRVSTPQAPEPEWLLIAAAIPLMLAMGNLYRTWDWPEDAAPDVLAFWSHLFATLLYLVLGLFLYEVDLNGMWDRLPTLAFIQLLVAGLSAPVLFRLQLHGGPVMLSQIGYVAAAVGLLVSTLVLGERYPTGTWFGAGMIAVGIGMTVWGARQSVR